MPRLFVSNGITSLSNQLQCSNVSVGSIPDSGLAGKCRDRLTFGFGSYSEFRGKAFALSLAMLTRDPPESENFPSNIDDGNNTKTVAYRDLKIWGIPSKILVRLSSGQDQPTENASKRALKSHSEKRRFLARTRSRFRASFSVF